MSRQWGRACSLIAAGKSGAIKLDSLRVKFNVSQQTIQTPNAAAITIYNAAESTAKLFLDKEFDRVELQAGYEDNIGTIFKGEIKQPISGRESPTDKFILLYAADGGTAYSFATISKTLAAGSTHQDQYNAVLEAMKPFGVEQGFTPPGLSSIKYPRPVVLFGSARDHLRRLAAMTGTTWSIQDGKLDMVPKDEPKPGGIIELNAETGMIGMPLQTPAGIMVRALINPAFRPHMQIKLNNSSIVRAPFNFDYTKQEISQQEPSLATLTSDGIYTILLVDWVGDTRGQPWYADLTCRGKAATTSQTQRSAYGIGP